MSEQHQYCVNIGNGAVVPVTMLDSSSIIIVSDAIPTHRLRASPHHQSRRRRLTFNTTPAKLIAIILHGFHLYPWVVY